jgi:hypothetical protein
MGECRGNKMTGFIGLAPRRRSSWSSKIWVSGGEKESPIFIFVLGKAKCSEGPFQTDSTDIFIDWALFALV